MRDDMTIRREQADDHAQIAALHDDAFERVEGAARSVESSLVDELRGDGDVIDELTFVAELDGAVVGHVMCSAATLGERPAVGLGPIAVMPALQRQGIGAALMASVIASAEQRGDAVIVLLGDPAYYGHFGFVPGGRPGHRVARPVGPRALPGQDPARLATRAGRAVPLRPGLRAPRRLTPAQPARQPRTGPRPRFGALLACRYRGAPCLARPRRHEPRASARGRPPLAGHPTPRPITSL